MSPQCIIGYSEYIANCQQTSIISHTFVGNKIVDHSDIVGSSPVGAARAIFELLQIWYRYSPIMSGTPSLRFSRYALRFFPPMIWTIFLPPKLRPRLPFYSDLVGSHFEYPPFSACSRSFCLPKLTKFIISFTSCWVPFWTSSCDPADFYPECRPPGQPTRYIHQPGWGCETVSWPPAVTAAATVRGTIIMRN